MPHAKLQEVPNLASTASEDISLTFDSPLEQASSVTLDQADSDKLASSACVAAEESPADTDIKVVTAAHTSPEPRRLHSVFLVDMPSTSKVLTIYSLSLSLHNFVALSGIWHQHVC